MLRASLVALALLAPTLALALAPAPTTMAERVADAAGVPVVAPVRADADLATLVARADARLGIERAPADLDALRALDPRLSAVLADLLAAVLHAADERDAAYAGVSDAEIRALADDEGSPQGVEIASRVDVERVRRAAVQLAAAVDLATPELVAIAAALPAPAAAPLGPPTVDVFPVIGVDPVGVPNTFPHDYFLSVDLGGNDVYDNNAGGSIIFGRGFILGDPSTFGPCAAGVCVGGEYEDAAESYTATLAIDVAGDDTYGVYKTPSTVGGSRDRFCTNQLLIRRIVTQGAGSGGIGQLYDLAGNDAHRAKTLSIGHGHVAGVGVYYDAGGDDAYTAVRSSIGSSVLQGVGVFVEAGGADEYRMAAPAGGIWNVDQGRCDATARLAMGAAVVQGSAAFQDLGGSDRYHSQSQAFGFGTAFGYATFLDAAGADDYGGYAGRVDGAQVNTVAATGGGVFRDV